jgi:hypothetical protein
MPYIFENEIRFENGKYILYNPSDLVNNFPFLEGNVVIGKIISMYKDNRIVRINKEFKCRIARSGNITIGEILGHNPVEELGLPLPSYFLIGVYKFEKENRQGVTKLFPIAQNIVLKGSYTSYFGDEIRRILKEEEAGLILEGTIFHPTVEKYSLNLKEALSSFEEENFAYAKTSCRKILEGIKGIVSEWKTIDESESLCEKLKSVVNSLYSFASIGGPHEGVVTKEETDLILKTTASLLFYINSLLKNQRIT